MIIDATQTVEFSSELMSKLTMSSLFFSQSGFHFPIQFYEWMDVLSCEDTRSNRHIYYHTHTVLNII